MELTKKQIMKYALFPQLLPRIGGLFSGGFIAIAYLVALIFRNAGIFPENHIFFQQESLGRYNTRQVMAAAANAIKLDRNHLDQVILYFAVLAGLVLLFLQAGVLLLSFFITPVFASEIGQFYASFFVTQAADKDIAFKIMDLTFGMPRIFESGATNVPTAFHKGLHALLRFYSLGILLVGSFIIIYFTITVAAETAQSGTPFGKRFNHAWVPIRIVLFFALLLPLGSGLNGAQITTMYMAKFGSGLATNSWHRYNEAVKEAYSTGAGNTELVAIPKVPEVMHIPAQIMLAKTCSWAYGRSMTHYAEGSDDTSDDPEKVIKAYLVRKPGMDNSIEFTAGTRYQEAVDYFGGGHIHISFGEKHPNFSKFMGNVRPYCGQMVVEINDKSEPGSAIISEGYFNILKCLWTETKDGGGSSNGTGSASTSGAGSTQECKKYDIEKYASNYVLKFLKPQAEDKDSLPLPESDYKNIVSNNIQQELETYFEKGVEAQIKDGKWGNEQEILDLGWAGAAIWYNKIAEQNGALVTAAKNVPYFKTHPEIMEKVRKTKLQSSKNEVAGSKYCPDTKNQKTFEEEEPIASVLCRVWTYWSVDNKKSTGSPIIDMINKVIGTQGLFDMCRNADVHPLAQLAAVGKSLMESAIKNIGNAAATGIGGGLGDMLASEFGAAGDAFAGFFTSIASTSLLIGFILFYVVPFMPFLYFFFAVGGWVKGIFEAMVGLPLWALAHLRIDGDGLPGNAAFGGYILIFEIFIRPVLIVIALLASVIIFTAMVKVLNGIYHLAVTNLSGFDDQAINVCSTEGNDFVGEREVSKMEYYRGPLDQFFFAIMYAIIVYIIGLSCFKLIDLIPNQIMRWLGGEVAAFNDNRGKDVDSMAQTIVVGGGIVGRQLQKGGQQLGKAASSLSKVGRNRRSEPGSADADDDTDTLGD